MYDVVVVLIFSLAGVFWDMYRCLSNTWVCHNWILLFPVIVRNILESVPISGQRLNVHKEISFFLPLLGDKRCVDIGIFVFIFFFLKLLGVSQDMCCCLTTYEYNFFVFRHC